MISITKRDWKRPLLILILAFCIWLSLQVVSPVYADQQTVGPGQTFIQDMVLVKFASEASPAYRAHVIDEMGGQIVRWIPALSTAQVRLSGVHTRGKTNPLEKILSHPMVVAVEWDGVVHGLPILEMRRDGSQVQGNSTIPATPVRMNDPDFNNPQKVYAPQLLQAPMAWNFTTGSPDVKIAVVDSGVDYTHPDLAGRVLPGYDFINDDDDPLDDHGHGTHIAGIIAAVGNNGVGMVGICPDCSIIPVKVLDANNVGTWGSVAAGITYAVDAGADIINLSLGGSSVAQAVREAVDYAVQHDVLVVAAAGNGRTDAPFYPAALDNVIGVSATRDDDTRWSLSNYGDYVDLAAPGFAIYSTYNDPDNFYGGYTFMSGTSMAAPHVAGVAALLLSQDPNRSAADLERLLRSSALDLGEPGRDDYFGYGRVDAFMALQLEAPLPQATAKMQGVIWFDENTNGVREQNERTVAAKILVEVQDGAGTTLATALPDEQGIWKLSGLAAGTYRVTVSTPENMTLTTTPYYDVRLADGQEYDGLDFGVTENASTQQQSYQAFVPLVIGE